VADVSSRNDLLIGRDQLEVKPAAASVAFQRQHIKPIVNDCSVMTDDEKKRLLQLIFTEIRADHTKAGPVVEFKVEPQWEPYVEFVQSERRQKAPAVFTI